MADKRYSFGFWIFVGALFALGLLGPKWERHQKEQVRKARREESERRIRALNKPIPTTPWIVCTGEGANMSCIVHQLPAVQ